MANLKPGNYFFIVPWVAFIPWYGMLITMLICWAAQGHPIYWFMNDDQFPVYISDVGATNLRPLFIACAGWQGLGYVISIACEYFQRSGRWPFVKGCIKNVPTADESSTAQSMDSFKTNYSEILRSAKFQMPPYFTKHERNCIFASFVLGAVGEICLLMCSIFSTALYHHVHIAMVSLFCVFMFLSVLCLSAEYFMMGRHYAQVHPLADPQAKLEETTWKHWVGHKFNKYTISAIAKVSWLITALIWAIAFGAASNNSISACFEWLLAFWFGVIFVIISVDFYLGSRYRYSKYFHAVTSFDGFYKYDKLVPPLAPEQV